MLEGKGNDDDGIKKMKETSDGKEDTDDQTFHRLHVHYNHAHISDRCYNKQICDTYTLLL